MRHNHQHKPDSMAILILAVTIGLLLTTIVQADDYLFGNDFTPSSAMVHHSSLPDTKTSWLLPGGKGVRTAVKGGMAHFQLNSQDDLGMSQNLPSNTQLTLSLGLEQSLFANQPNYRNSLGQLKWYDFYRPAMYFSVGHRWK